MANAHPRAEPTGPVATTGAAGASELTALVELAVRTRDPATVRRVLEGIAPSVRGVCRGSWVRSTPISKMPFRSV